MRMPKCPGIPERAGVEVIDEHQFAARTADDLNSNRTRQALVGISLTFLVRQPGKEAGADDAVACIVLEIWAISRARAKKAPTVAVHLRKPVGSESSTHAGVAIAITRLVADIRMQQPSTQQALSNETGSFQHAGRTDILDIAHRANAEYRRLA